MLAVRTWKYAVIQSWQAHFQSKTRLLLKTILYSSDRCRWQAVLSLTCSFCFCRRFQHDFLFLSDFTGYTGQLSFKTHTLHSYTHTDTQSHSVCTLKQQRTKSPICLEQRRRLDRQPRERWRLSCGMDLIKSMPRVTLWWTGRRQSSAN